MKFRLIICAFIAIVASSCQKVIDVDLSESDPLVVIEAAMFENDPEFVVHISKSTSYFDEKEPPVVANASVSLNSSLGEEFVFEYLGDGDYQAIEFMPQTGTTYTLKVMVEGTEYTSVARMPVSIPLDTITYEFQEGSLFFSEGYSVYCEVLDPLEQENYYRVVLTVNDTLKDEISDLFLFDDEFANGNRIRIPLFNDIFQAGDVIDMTLLTMDKDVYRYLVGLSELADNGSSAAPANPISNINNGALGYFGAYTVSTRTVIIQE